MQIKDGKIILETGEKLFPAKYLGRETIKGNRKSDNTPYNYIKHRFDLILTRVDGTTYTKFCECLLDPNERIKIDAYSNVYVVFSIMNNPLKAPTAIYFIPRNEEPKAPKVPDDGVLEPATTDDLPPMPNSGEMTPIADDGTLPLSALAIWKGRPTKRRNKLCEPTHPLALSSQRTR